MQFVLHQSKIIGILFKSTHIIAQAHLVTLKASYWSVALVTTAMLLQFFTE